MNRLLPYVVTLALGLWAGGLVALILFVSTLFVKARTVAAETAPALFDVFEKYQLILAVIALLALVVWRWAGRTRSKTFALSLTMLATLLAFVQISYITPVINRTRNTDRPTFDRYHRLASTNYTIISGLVVLSLGFTVAATKHGSRWWALDKSMVNASEPVGS